MNPEKENANENADPAPPEKNAEKEEVNQDNQPPEDADSAEVTDENADGESQEEITGEKTALSGWDKISFFLLILLAVLLSFFAINNSRFWLHLATGRYLSQTLSGIGIDPFCFTTQGVLWVNHSWLFDLGLYSLWNVSGGAGWVLIVAKCLLVVILVFLLLRLSNYQQRPWLTFLCLLLALLAMSPRFRYQPYVISFLFLGLSLWILFGDKVSRDSAQYLRRLWFLPVLFASWVNLDEWYILGPITFGLYLLGRAIEKTKPTEEKSGAGFDLKKVGLIFGVSILACFVNPYLWKGITLPLELAYIFRGTAGFLPDHFLASGITIREIEQVEPGFTNNFSYWFSPLTSTYWQQTFRTVNISGQAFILLFLMGAGSFVWLLMLGNPNKEEGPSWECRLVLWVFFAFLALSMARLIPFFAIAAGPITVWNFQDILKQIQAKKAQGKAANPLTPLIGRAFFLLFVLGLIVLAWPGWLRGNYGSGQSPFRVSGEIVVDPSLKEMALKVQEKELQNGFNFNPNFACYCAWFAPAVKNYYDLRFSLFNGKGETIGKIRQSLRRGEDLSKQQNREAFKEAIRTREKEFSEQEISFVAYSNLNWDSRAFQGVIIRLFEPRRWTLVDGDGETVVYKWWQQPPSAKESEEISLDIPEAAFRPGKEWQLASSEMVFPVSFPWETEFFVGTRRPVRERNRARFLLGCYTVLLNRRYNNQRAISFTRYASSKISAMVDRGGISSALGIVANDLMEQSTQPQDHGTPGLALLAVRSARKAVRENPTDADAYLVLADAYDALSNREEKHWSGRFKEWDSGLRELVRRIQTTTALRHALELDPDNPEIHWKLGLQYQAFHYLDVASFHFSRTRELLQKSPEKVTKNPLFQKVKRDLDEGAPKLAQDVENRLKSFELLSENLSNRKKFTLALNVGVRYRNEKGKILMDRRGFGLVLQALKVLKQESQQNPLDTGFSLGWQLHLRMTLGEAETVANRIQALNESGSSSPEFLQPTLELAAAMGDYKLFHAVAREMDLGNRFVIQQNLLPALNLPPFSYHQNSVPEMVNYLFFNFNYWKLLEDKLSHRGELALLDGLMALEQGEIPKAKMLLQRSIPLMASPQMEPEVNVARGYLRQIYRFGKED